MEKRRILYTQPTIEASTKLHPEKSLAASCRLLKHYFGTVVRER
jgi:hypothetical protein